VMKFLLVRGFKSGILRVRRGVGCGELLDVEKSWWWCCVKKKKPQDSQR
jgi:hypothetical protein